MPATLLAGCRFAQLRKSYWCLDGSGIPLHGPEVHFLRPDVGGLGEEVGDGVRDILGLEEGFAGLRPLLRDRAAAEIGEDAARREVAAADTVRLHLLGEREHEAAQSPLRRAIG